MTAFRRDCWYSPNPRWAWQRGPGFADESLPAGFEPTRAKGWMDLPVVWAASTQRAGTSLRGYVTRSDITRSDILASSLMEHRTAEPRRLRAQPTSVAARRRFSRRHPL